ncbi:hypothetical protein [Nostoc sp. MS1]|uniref:hypothetical protein n=1 Tax=Nostoc sp. MS1 TaxID=2764711 RepID=UPI001CC3CB21|nr:hypothetical protein [Nostoc sp. MS1]BCL39469.1 hypothetical protein NSMS1_59160 [Nostoc sp. MS1]
MSRFQYSLTITFFLTSLTLNLISPIKTFAQCSAGSNNCNNQPNNSTCNSRNPYKLTADTSRVRRIIISWDVCQKNDFYQVSWGDGKEDIAQVDDANARSWTYAGARDMVKYNFKIRGCNGSSTPSSTQQPDCTPWQELSVTTPDW